MGLLGSQTAYPFFMIGAGARAGAAVGASVDTGVGAVVGTEVDVVVGTGVGVTVVSVGVKALGVTVAVDVGGVDETALCSVRVAQPPSSSPARTSTLMPMRRVMTTIAEAGQSYTNREMTP